MKPLYLFDVDGTLTPSRQQINEDFRLFMLDFCKKFDCAIVTGSDKEKTIEQIGEELYNKFKVQFQCGGNQVCLGSDEILSESDWILDGTARYFLDSCEYESKFPLRTGKHVEHRCGMVNFSVVGRNATLGERLLYVEYDKSINERETIAKAFNTMFPDLKAVIGGQTGIDISPIGKDKGQVTEWFTEREFIFFGDDCQEGGNDFPLASKIIENNLGSVYNVDNDKQTYEILKEIN